METDVAGSFDMPATLDGWTITPALAEGQGEPKLVVEDGKLMLKNYYPLTARALRPARRRRSRST